MSGKQGQGAGDTREAGPRPHQAVKVASNPLTALKDGRGITGTSFHPAASYFCKTNGAVDEVVQPGKLCVGSNHEAACIGMTDADQKADCAAAKRSCQGSA